MRKIYLVGFMGCGKSALGRRLSYLLKMPYYDMDHEIVRQQGMTIPQIFEKYGEARFREIETEFLKISVMKLVLFQLVVALRQC